MKTELIVCFSCIALYIVVCIVNFIRVSSAKKKVTVVPPTEAPYTGSLVATAIVELLPILIPLGLKTIVITGLCGILGAVIVFKERLASISSN